MPVTTAGLEGVVATESRLCYIDGDAGILSYYGFRIETLAEHAQFEEVIFLLWNGRLPKHVENFLGGVPQGASAMHVLRTAVSMLALYDPLLEDTSLEANQRKAVKLMAQTATIVTSFQRLRAGKQVVPGDPKLGFAANFLYTLNGKPPDHVMEHAFDIALTLHAEHELNASTFAARVTAATLSDIYSAITSGIGALRGPLHGGANEEVIKLLLQVNTVDEGLNMVKDMLAN